MLKFTWDCHLLPFRWLTLHRRKYAPTGEPGAWEELPARPTSGASIGILDSFWITTRRRAWGWGHLCPWAQAQHMEWHIAGQIFSSESGILEVQPPARFTAGEPVSFRLRNRNDCFFRGEVFLLGLGYHGAPDFGATGVSFHRVVEIRAKESTELIFQPPADIGTPIDIYRLNVVARPIHAVTRWGRIHGGPEWIDTRS